MPKPVFPTQLSRQLLPIFLIVNILTPTLLLLAVFGHYPLHDLFSHINVQPKTLQIYAPKAQQNFHRHFFPQQNFRRHFFPTTSQLYSCYFAVADSPLFANISPTKTQFSFSPSLTMNVADSLRFHGFSLANHRDCPLFFLKLRFLHPRNPIIAGTASETPNGIIQHAPPLTMETIANIINATFDHHVAEETATYVSLQLVQIDEHLPDRDQNQTYFTLLFRQNPDITDAIDPLLVLDQLRLIAWCDWLHFDANGIRHNREINMTTRRPASITKPHERVLIPSPTNSPWTPYLDLYMPACNCNTERALGILSGLPLTMPPLSHNRRLLTHLTECLFHILDSFLPPVLRDITTFFNLIGIRRGTFSSAAPLHKTNTVAYIAASSQNMFNLLYQAHRRYLQNTNKPCINLYGFQVRINPMPDRSRQGIEIRTQIHQVTDFLHSKLKPAKKIRIPIEYFTEDLTESTIQRILRTRLVIALVPDFHDESDDKITHYVLFVTHNYQTFDLELTNLETKLPDFPQNLVSIPSPPPLTPQQQLNDNNLAIQPDHQDDLAAFAFMLNSPALTTNSDSHSSSTNSHTSIPRQIYTPKRPHLPTGETVKPTKHKPRHRTMLLQPPSPGPNTAASTSEDTSTQDVPYPTFTEHQTDDDLMDAEASPRDEEYIPDSQYEFLPEHSQPTRLEIRDALGIAASFSDKRYHEIYQFITSHGSAPLDLDTLKQLATRPLTPLPPSTRAHNDSTAQNPNPT
jgi:hypothetical protein